MSENDHIPVERKFAEPPADQLRDQGHQRWLDSYYTSSSIGWSDVLPGMRTVVLGEAKCGKTHEFRHQVESFKQKGEFAFFLPLEQLHDQDIEVVLTVEDEDSLSTWLQQTEKEAWFFLDAVDELRLRDGSFKIALRKLQRVIGKKAPLAHIFVSCRPADWNLHLDGSDFLQYFPMPIPRKAEKPEVPQEEGFWAPIQRERIITTERVNESDEQSKEETKPRVLVMQPLTQEQTIEFANQHDPKKAQGLREKIEKREVWHFFQTPADIMDGMALMTENGELGTLEEQISSGINYKLRDRHDRTGGQLLTLDKARSGAERLALALSLMKRRSLALQKASPDNEQLVVGDILSDWTTPEQRELLGRGIFDLSGINTVQFHHRSTHEFLAAKRLKKHISEGLPLSAVMDLLFDEIFGEQVVIPSMEPVAAWLALWNQDILREIKKRKPELLFKEGLPASLPIDVRKEILRCFVSSYQGDDWRGIDVTYNYNDVARLGHSELGPIVEELWHTAYSGYDTRELLLQLIWLTPLPACAYLSFDAAFDTKLSLDHRIYACRGVLAAGASEQKQGLGQVLLNEEWGAQLVYRIIPDLYPGSLRTDEIVALAKKTKEIPNTVDGLGFALYSLIHREEVGIEQVRSLRAVFTKEVWANRRDDCDTYRCHSAFDHFTDAILAACARDMDIASPEEISDWTWSAAIALRFGERQESIIARKDTERICSRIKEDVRLREAYFWASLSMADELEPGRDPWYRYAWEIKLHDSVLGEMSVADIPWLFKALEETTQEDRRPVAFFALMDVWRATRDDGISEGVRSRISDIPELIKELEKYMKPPPSSQSRKLDRKYEKLKKKQKRKEKKRLAGWESWRLEIQRDPKGILDQEKKKNTLWNLFKWLRLNRDPGNSWNCWNANKILEAFSREFMQLLKPVLGEFWRETNPRLWSEREAENRNSYPVNWLQALMAVSCEADDPDWADKLTEDEAKLATRISMLELNGFASYFPALEKAKPDAVCEVIIGELAAQISLMPESGECPLLHTLNFYGTDKIKKEVANFLGKALADWPCEMTDQIRDALGYSAGLIADFGSVATVKTASSHATHHLKKADFTIEDKAAWLRTLMALDTADGCRHVLQETTDLEDETDASDAVLIFGTVFGGRYNTGSRPDFSSMSIEERADILFQLVIHAFEVVHPSSDIRHDGVFSPGARDHAEGARSFLFEQLVELGGQQTHAKLLRLAGMDNFAHMKDRLRQMAIEVAAKASEPSPMPLDVFRSLDEEQNLIPTDNRSIHNVLLNRMNDFFHFVKESEFSPQETLQRIEKEPELRRYIANWLNEHSRDAYTVNQEAVKKGEKETDIRLTSSYKDIESTIELKLDDKCYRWSGSQLEDALRNQLVGKYLSHKRCRSGCLLICMRERRKWENPYNRKKMNLTETVDWLQGIADEIMKENPELLVSVRGLDLSL